MPRQPLETLALLPTGQMVVDYYSSNGNLNKYKRGKKGKEYLPIPIVLEAITGMDVWIFAAALLRQKEEILTSLIAWRLLHLHHSTKYIQLFYADHLLKDCHVHKGGFKQSPTKGQKREDNAFSRAYAACFRRAFLEKRI
ncbi:hypothetical protein SCLCIDRAFT_24051 [Scleroderma citrinum Foug A]|uniref:Uncharacterized protein n=1 Tax=Scleroderma citrinum Foug A TaxID=1036808 RepID=A0A0C3AFC3_9AGAM|nr:hypothetical protein SCLCIDRAFT_24051 [Scleroderma citrinum Foug A]